MVAGSRVGAPPAAGPTHLYARRTGCLPQTKQSLQILQDLYSWKLVPESVYFRGACAGQHRTGVSTSPDFLSSSLTFPQDEVPRGEAETPDEVPSSLVDINSQDEVFSDSSLQLNGPKKGSWSRYGIKRIFSDQLIKPGELRVHITI